MIKIAQKGLYEPKIIYISESMRLLKVKERILAALKMKPYKLLKTLKGQTLQDKEE